MAGSARASRQLAFTAVLGVVAIAAVVVSLAHNPGPSALRSSPPAPTPSGDAASLAADACRAASRFEEQVRANAQASAAMSTLATAEQAGVRAAELDPRYLALAGAVQALRVGMQHNDASATEVGITVVRDECTRLRQ